MAVMAGGGGSLQPRALWCVSAIPEGLGWAHRTHGGEGKSENVVCRDVCACVQHGRC